MLSRFNKLSYLFIAILLLALPLKAAAYDLGPVHMHGFLAQGYVLSTGNEYISGSEDGGSFDFTQAGVNFLYRPKSNVILFSQFLSRNFGDAYSNEKNISIDYLFMSMNLVSQVEHEFGFKIGRIKNAYGLLNNIRDVPFTHVGILMNQTLYNEYDRYLALYGDGVLFDYKYKQDWGQINLLAEIAQLSDNKKDMFATSPEILEYVDESEDVLAKSLQIIYTSRDGSIQLAYANNILDDRNVTIRNMPHTSGALAGVGPVNTDWVANAVNHIFSFKYSKDDYAILSEYMRRTIDNDYSHTILAIPMVVENGIEQKSNSYYLQGSYRFNYAMEGYIGYHYSKLKENGETSYDSPYNQYRKQWSVGLDWEVYDSILLKSEVHFIDGTYEILQEPGVNASGEIDRKWNMFLMQLSYKF